MNPTECIVIHDLESARALSRIVKAHCPTAWAVHQEIVGDDLLDELQGDAPVAAAAPAPVPAAPVPVRAAAARPAPAPTPALEPEPAIPVDTPSPLYTPESVAPLAPPEPELVEFEAVPAEAPLELTPSMTAAAPEALTQTLDFAPALESPPILNEVMPELEAAPAPIPEMPRAAAPLPPARPAATLPGRPPVAGPVAATAARPAAPAAVPTRAPAPPAPPASRASVHARPAPIAPPFTPPTEAAYAPEPPAYESPSAAVPAQAAASAHAAAPAQASGRERRRHKRFAQRFRVVLVSGEKVFRTYSSNISLGGMLLSNRIPAAMMNETCTVYIGSADSKENIELRCRLIGDAQEANRIRFEEAAAIELRRLEEWIMQASAAHDSVRSGGGRGPAKNVA